MPNLISNFVELYIISFYSFVLNYCCLTIVTEYVSDVSGSLQMKEY